MGKENLSAIMAGYLRWRCGVGGVRQERRESDPKGSARRATAVYDQPIDDVRRVAVCVR